MRYDREKRHLLGSLRREVHDERVLDALMAVRREAFVPHELDARAYDNVPLPIGEGQTISQPPIVGIMLEGLAVQPGDHRARGTPPLAQPERSKHPRHCRSCGRLPGRS